MALMMGAASWAMGQEGVKVNEADFASFQKLRYEAVMKESRSMFAHEEKQKAEVKAKWEAALKDAGWNEEKYQSIRDAVEQTAQALTDTAKGGEDADNAKETLYSQDKTTIETVKAHLKEYGSDSDLRQKAEKQVREEAEAEKRGAPVEAKALEGKWVFDLDATAELNAQGMGEDAKKAIREAMGKAMTGASLHVRPGGQHRVHRPAGRHDADGQGNVPDRRQQDLLQERELQARAVAGCGDEKMGNCGWG